MKYSSQNCHFENKTVQSKKPGWEVSFVREYTATATTSSTTTATTTAAAAVPALV